MKRKYLIKQKHIVKTNKRKALRDVLLPLVNSGSAAKEDLILCAGGRKELKVHFITQKQYQMLKAERNAED